jgi:hypothetical protein
MLRQGSAISDDVIRARGYRTITATSELVALGFAPSQCQPPQVPGLLLPLHTTDGQIGPPVYRPDNPRVIEEKRRGKLVDGTYPNRVLKYEVPKDSGTRLDCPPTCRSMLADPHVPLWITEGQKKADALASVGMCAIALMGVWNWRGRNDDGGTTFLTDWDYVALNGRDVRIVFDSDVMGKAGVRAALDRLTEHLQRKGAHVTAVYLPGDGHVKVGVDDYLAEGHTVQELQALVEAPRPVPTAAAPRVELLDSAPPTMRRPLALIDGEAYAAIWPYCRVTVTEGLNSKGEVVAFHPPKVTTGQRLLIVRRDGLVFGDGGDSPSSDLGIDVVLPEVPPGDRLWRSPAVVRYRQGWRPDPADVFARAAAVVSYFIDFSRSLADQATMAEMVACYVLASWLLDALNVVGFLWPNGDRGSGKTQLLLVTSAMSYLGMMLLAGGSYASLRDLADYGATLAFDDAENLSDPRRTDPDKRALLLAGNRRGSVVTVKEPSPDGTWRTRHVNAFCPRLFSAIAMPDTVLASRTIVVPLIRTADKAKANSDPADHASWPHDRATLVDDLWALGLAYLPEVGQFEAEACEKARVQGRTLEPWRAILTIAAWLESNGVADLYHRMEALSFAYQSERPELETTDLTVLTLRALCHCAITSMRAISVETPSILSTTADVRAAVERIAEEDEMDISWMGDASRQSKRIGRVLGRLRLKKASRPGGKGSRQWRYSISDLRALLRSYGLSVPTELNMDPLSTNGSLGCDGPNGTVVPSENDGHEPMAEAQQLTIAVEQAPTPDFEVF